MRKKVTVSRHVGDGSLWSTQYDGYGFFEYTIEVDSTNLKVEDVDVTYSIIFTENPTYGPYTAKLGGSAKGSTFRPGDVVRVDSSNGTNQLAFITDQPAMVPLGSCVIRRSAARATPRNRY